MSTITKDLGAVTAYAYAKEKGYTGTEAEYAELMASYASVAQQAGESAQTATEKAQQASASATSASQSADTASASATSAQTSAQTATAKASEAQQSATTATTKAQEASQSASESSQSASTAVQAKQDAQTAKTASETAQASAESARDDAETARDEAQQYAESIDPENIFSAYATDTVSGSVASFADGADDIPMKSVVVNIEPVQSGSGDPSPTNVRPISGWTGAQVVRTGVNVCDEEWELGTIRQSDGLFAPDDTRIRSKNFNPCVPETTYYVKDSTNDNNISLRWYDANEGFISSSGWIGNTTITSPVNAYYFAIVMASGYGTTYNHDISINYPSTDHDYHTFTGSNTYEIAFPTEAGTVYGGTLDVTNGTLTVDRAMVVFDGSSDEQWTLQSINDYGIANYYTNVDHYPAVNFRSLCNMLSPQAGTITNTQTEGYIVHQNGGTMYIRLLSSRASTVTELRTWLASNPIQIVYALAEPITYHLTPTEIKSLLGDNNVWADAGDAEVTYRADTKLYIEKKLGKDAPMIATSNIVSGSYFMVGNNLYKATANISSGAAVVVGTNATAKTMAEALNEINA